MCLRFAPLLDNRQDGFLHTGHHSVGPEPCVPVQIGGNAMLTQQVQPCLAIGRRLDYVLSTENVEERPADANVLIRGWAESDRFAFKCYGGASELTSVSNFGSRPWQRQPPRLTSSILQNPLEKGNLTD